MAILELKPTVKELVRFAGKAITDEKYFECVQNLNDAYEIATTPEDRATIFRCFSDLYNHCGNIIMAKCALFRSCVETDKGSYYSLDLGRFFPDEGIIEEEETPLLDSDTILGYNDVYNYFMLGEYEKGLNILCSLQPDLKSLDALMEPLMNAINDGAFVDLGKHIYKLLFLAGFFALKSGDFVRLLLQGGKESRMFIIGGADFFVDEIDDANILFAIGEAFYEAKIYDCAEKYFKKMLSLSEISITANYYLSAIYYATDNAEEGEKYYNRMKVCLKRYDYPNAYFTNVLKQKCAPIFLDNRVTVPSEVMKFWRKEFRADMEFDEYRDYLQTVIYFADEYSVLTRVFNKTNPLLIGNLGMIKNALISPLLDDKRKEYLLRALLEYGYEGRISVLFRNRGIMTDMASLKLRGGKVWEEVYNNVYMGLFTADEFIPLRTSMLKALVKLLAKRCSENKIKPETEDVPFLTEIVARSYNAKARMNGTNIQWVSFGLAISGEELRRGLTKFPPEVIAF